MEYHSSSPSLLFSQPLAASPFSQIPVVSIVGNQETHASQEPEFISELNYHKLPASQIHLLTTTKLLEAILGKMGKASSKKARLRLPEIVIPLCQSVQSPFYSKENKGAETDCTIDKSRLASTVPLCNFLSLWKENWTPVSCSITCISIHLPGLTRRDDSLYLRPGEI